MSTINSSAYITLADLETVLIDEINDTDKTLIETENGTKTVDLSTLVQKITQIIDENGDISAEDETAVKFIEQSLTDEQKFQARKNIEADKIYLSDIEPDAPVGSFWIDTSDNSGGGGGSVVVDCSADSITYDNDESNLSSTNVQDAIDELNTNTKTSISKISDTVQEAIDELSGSIQNITADKINYNNYGVEGTPTNVQDVIDTIGEGLTNLQTEVNNKQNTIATTKGTITWGDVVNTTARAYSLRKYGNVVVFTFTFHVANEVAANTTLVTLPTGFRPSEGVWAVMSKCGAATTVNLNLGNNGVLVSPNSKLDANGYYAGNITFII